MFIATIVAFILFFLLTITPAIYENKKPEYSIVISDERTINLKGRSK